MHKKKYIEFIGTFLIILILTIPFSIAKINSVSASGSDGVEGYMKPNDFLNFIVQAVINGAAITQEQLKLGNKIQFDKCSASASSGSECSARYPSSSTDSFIGIISYTITLFGEDKATVDDTKSGRLFVDNLPPKVSVSTTQKRFSLKDNVVINYDATDFACNLPDCENKCVGIKSIDFYTLDGSFKKTQEISSGGCNAKDSITLDPKTFPDGKNSVFAKATDKFGQVSPETSVTFTVDTTGPNIISGSFDIVRKGISISTFSSQSVPVDVSVNISADDFDLNSATADLTQLNPSQDFKNLKASCIQVKNDLSACSWKLNLRPGTEGAKSILISASDTSGNIGTATLSRQFTADNKGPDVTSLSTLLSKGDKILARPTGNTIVATFDESTGLSAYDVYLDVDGNSLQAAQCTKGTGWACTWNDVALNNNAKITIASSTTDILGNTVNNNKIVEVSVDAKAPVLKYLNISAVGGNGLSFPGIFKIGDKIGIAANVTEENDLTAVADFSKFITDANKVSGRCGRNNAGDYFCTWTTENINLAASDFVVINFTDSAGNSLIEKRALTTFGLDNSPVPDFWSNEVSCSPKTVDRSIGTLISQRVYCQVKLTPKGTNKASIVYLSPASCTGDTSIVDNFETFNREAGSTTPIVKITLKKTDYKIDQANITCSFNIFSKVTNTNTVTKNPEIENAKIYINFYNFPLGELGDAVQKKIDDAKKDALDLHKKIKALNTFLQFAKKACQVFGIIYSMVTAYYAVTGLLFKAQDLCYTLPGLVPTVVCIPPTYVAKTASCFGQQATHSAADFGWKTSGGPFCKFVNCQWAPGVLGKWQNFVTDKINKLPLADRLPGPGAGALPGVGSSQPQAGGGRTGLAGYMDPNENLFTAMLFGCIPGIINGIDKYSQIKCLYADCLQNAVGKEGLPITACEKQKSYATCKYIYGEIFALNPYTAVFDHFTGLLKDALSNPFAAIGLGVGAVCAITCPQKIPGSFILYDTCEGFRILAKSGEVLKNVQGLINDVKSPPANYCNKLELEDNAAKSTEPAQDLSTTAKRS